MHVCSRQTLRAAGLIALLAWAMGGPAAASGDPLARVRAFVREEMARQKVPGVAFAIVRHGDVLAAEGLGFANVELQVPVTAETIFESGSVGKQFTATAVMLQVEAGRLSLDDPITRFFPDAPASWRDISVRRLLTHTSGIPDYTDGAVDYRRDYTEAELVTLAYELPLEFPPGSRWSYSNTGYVLLGIIVHRVSGQFYGDVLARQVFAPLGMTTARVISESDIVMHRAAGYRLEKGALKNQDWVSPSLNTTADGSLYLSVRDLVAWDRGLRAREILKPESWAQIFTPVTLTSGKTYPYGFGWEVDTVAGQPRRHHGGSWQGFKTYISRYLGDDLTVIVLANLADADPSIFVDGIAGILNPALERPELTAIPDHEPEVAGRLRELLKKAGRGALMPTDFGVAARGLFPNRARQYQAMLAPLGPPTRIELAGRRELGDDLVYTYLVAFGERPFVARLALGPDNRPTDFSVRPR